ncbi:MULTISPECIES: hypothetical protein [unclassified Rathayibacter]|uniref:hypothetical protein n=1 Tax=unclassified Rathayibacter TaxID=2609250 RepID=UPI0012E8282B|nr:MULTISPECIES: hypothetical protein [unclassified Rathayibacter]
MTKRYTMVALGRPVPGYAELWESQPEIAGIVRFEHAQPQGIRWGRRALGLGVDAAVVAVKAVLTGPRRSFLALNPWTGAALRLLGRRDLAVTGLYAREGSRSWRILRRLLGSAPVIATVEVEAAAWTADGGRAAHVLYGTEFPYPSKREHDAGQPPSLFVGGSSDRDRTVVDALIAQVLDSPDPIHLTLAIGRESSPLSNGAGSRVVSVGPVTQAEFGRLMSEADLVFLPLKIGERAAGHMVTVGALQIGVPVATTPSIGMKGYIDGVFVRVVRGGDTLLADLLVIAREMRTRTSEIRAHWAATHSRTVNARAVLDALAALEQASSTGTGRR